MTYLLATASTASLTPEYLAHMVADLHLVIVDIRMDTAHRQDAWSGVNLAQQYGARYRYLPDLANVNHKVQDMSKGVAFVDYDTGYAKLMELNAKSRVMLLCSCHSSNCEKHEIARRHEAATGRKSGIIEAPRTNEQRKKL